jgi:hypothetical protein
MLDSAFRSSRKFLGIPLAILVVVVIAVLTGGTVLAAYMLQEANIETTVKEPLTFDYTVGEWQDVGGVPWWTPTLYACESKTTRLTIFNAASVDVPLSVQSNTSDADGVVNCFVNVWDKDDQLTQVVPAGELVTVEVTVTASCSVVIPQGSPLVTHWAVQFSRG